MRTVSGLGVVAFLGGIWVALSPFVTGAVPATGNPWVAAVLVPVVVGVTVAVGAVVGLLGLWGHSLKAWERQSPAGEPSGRPRA
ncbi:MAG: hypothetical protein K6V97_08495 [Actinomycetia bacterium]|nr:hypothetical protein [Actinomycetes bacterium]